MPATLDLLNHPVIASRYFFPRRSALPNPAFVDCGDATLACHHQSPHPGARTLVHFHGNGEVVSDYVPDLASLYMGLGVNVFMAEYRGYGASTGQPALGAMLGDARRVAEHLKVPASDLVIYGRSVGSIFALELASQLPGVAGLIIESGIAEPLDRLLIRLRPEELGVDLDTLQAAADAHLDHRRKIAATTCPVLILHTRHDGLVDLSHAEQLAEWAGDRAELVVFERGDHNSILYANLDAIMATLRRFLGRLGP